MNALTRTMLVLAIATLILTGPIPAQESVNEPAREALAAQREVQIAQKEAEATQQQAQAEVKRAHALVSAMAVQPAAPAAPTPPAAAPQARVTGISVNGPWSVRSASPVLVIPSAQIEIDELAAIAEDMNVMSRIFEQNLEQARIPTARGGRFASSRDPWVALLGGGSAIESMYLQGYGALFMMKVDFPLSPPPQAEEEKPAEQKADSDLVWEQTRRRMYEPQEVARDSQKEPEVKYDAEKVENLKTTLIKSLKHAANIRSLKSDESVILTVTGSGRSGGTHVEVAHSRGTSVVQRSQGLVTEKGGDGPAKARIVAMPPSGQTSSFSPTVLVIRAKKADIDQFAKGALDADQFRQRVQVLTCAYLSAESGYADNFNPYYRLQQEVSY